MTTRLQFEARITGLKPVMPKPAENSYTGPKPGHLELSLRIDEPTMPRAPQVPYDIQSRGMGERGIAPRPAELPRLQKGPNESKPEFEARKVAELEVQQRQYDQLLARYQAEVAAFEQAQAAFGQRLMTYGSLIGMVSILGNRTVRIDLSPQDAGMLPGFQLDLLPPPAPEPGPIETIATVSDPLADFKAIADLDDDEDDRLYHDPDAQPLTDDDEEDGDVDSDD
jgi:hypothetical protein